MPTEKNLSTPEEKTEEKKLPKKRRLTYKQKQFAKKFIECNGNATEAVRQSYPNIKTLSAQTSYAHTLITQSPNVLAEIERIMSSKGLTVDVLSERLEGLTKHENPTAQNQAIRTSLEMLKIIGSGSHNAVQVNINLEDSALDRIRALLQERRAKDRIYQAQATMDTGKPDVSPIPIGGITPPPVDNMGTKSE